MDTTQAVTLSPQSPFSDCWQAWCESRAASRCLSSQQAYGFTWRIISRSMPVNLPICEITQQHINDFVLARIKEKISSTTIRNQLDTLSAILNWCEAQGIIDRSPYIRRRLPALPQNKSVRRVPFTHEQYRRIVEQIDRNPMIEYLVRERWVAACHIAYWTGLRLGDVATLCWQQPEGGLGTWVDMIEQLVIAHPIKKIARRERLEIPIEPVLYEILQQAAARRVDGNPYVLPGMAAAYLTSSQGLLSHLFSTLCDNAGLPEHSFHSFRHGFVTRLINGGVDPLIIGSMTGQTVEQIAQYAHVSNQAKSVALSKVREAMQQVRQMA